MSIKINRVEIYPFEDNRTNFYNNEFKPVDIKEVPPEIVEQFKENIKTSKIRDLHHRGPKDYKNLTHIKHGLNIYKRDLIDVPRSLSPDEAVEFSLKRIKFNVASSDQVLYDKFKDDLMGLVDLVGLEVQLKELPISNKFADLSKIHFELVDDGTALELSLQVAADSMGWKYGPCIQTIATIGKIYLDVTIKEICDKCGSILKI